MLSQQSGTKKSKNQKKTSGSILIIKIIVAVIITAIAIIVAVIAGSAGVQHQIIVCHGCSLLTYFAPQWYFWYKKFLGDL